MIRPGRLAVLLPVMALAAPAGEAQTYHSTLASSLDFSDMGRSVSLSGNTLAVGAPRDNGGGNSSGAVEIFVRSGSTWTFQAELVVPGITSGSELGHAVSLEGDVVLAGAWGESDGSWVQPGYRRGAAAIFRRAGASWTLEAQLQPASVLALDFFGRAVALSGDVAAVGAPYADPLGESSGRVWIFRRVAGVWTEESTLVAPDGASGHRFGEAVALQGSTLVVGAPAAGGVVPDTGAAYVFNYDGSNWPLQQRLAATDGARGDRYASALALDGDRLAVGVPRRDPAGVGNAGAVAVYALSAGVWQPETWLAAAVPHALDNLGSSIALRGEFLIAGAPDADSAAPMGGAAYLWHHVGSAWVASNPLLAPPTTATDSCGISVAVDGDWAAVGNLWRLAPGFGSNGGVDLWNGVLSAGGAP